MARRPSRQPASVGPRRHQSPARQAWPNRPTGGARLRRRHVPPPAQGPLTSWVTRIVTGPSTLVDARGHRWLPDTGYVGGRSAVTSARIEGTSSQPSTSTSAGACAHTSSRCPRRPPTRSTCISRRRGSRDHASGSSTSRAEGVVKASDVDIVKAAGKNHAYHVGFTAAVTDGRLDLDFINRVDQAKVSGIEVAFLRRSTAAPAPGLVGRVQRCAEFAGGQPSLAPRDRRCLGEGELQSYTSRTANALSGRAWPSRDRRPCRAVPGRGLDHAGLHLGQDQHQGQVLLPVRHCSKLACRRRSGGGIWPAFWALGNDIDRSGWPECGEIDVMEHLGQEPRKASGHNPRTPRRRWARRTTSRVTPSCTPSPLSQGFHTYGVQWLPGSIQFSFDGRPYWSITAADLPVGSRWVFDHPFYLVLNVAVGAVGWKPRCQHDVPPGAGGGLCSGLSVTGRPALLARGADVRMWRLSGGALHVVPGLTPGRQRGRSHPLPRAFSSPATRSARRPEAWTTSVSIPTSQPAEDEMPAAKVPRRVGLLYRGVRPGILLLALLGEERAVNVISAPLELARSGPPADVVVVDVPAEDRRAVCEVRHPTTVR